MTDYGYAIDPRPAELGGGWRLPAKRSRPSVTRCSSRSLR